MGGYVRMVDANKKLFRRRCNAQHKKKVGGQTYICDGRAMYQLLQCPSGVPRSGQRLVFLVPRASVAMIIYDQATLCALLSRVRKFHNSGSCKIQRLYGGLFLIFRTQGSVYVNVSE